MPTNDTETALANELSAAIDELQLALQGASSAASRIKSLIPRVSAVNSLLDEIGSLIQERRESSGAAAFASAAYARPTLVVTETEQAPIAPASPTIDPPAATQETLPEPATLPQVARASSQELICFRLEFQSNSGPLDLRAVDDAVSEHPAVRDVALLDYDGRRATLKVWIVADASPADVQDALTERAAELFADASDVTIVALEDAA
jgi:hypothetical protein